MLKKNEIRILRKIFENLSKEYTINELSQHLGQKYMQTYRSIKELEKKELITLNSIGKSSVVNPDFSKYHPEHICVEIERFLKIKNKKIRSIHNELSNLDKDFICILFGSYANDSQTNDSDIDLLFILNKSDDLFEKKIRNKLSLYNADIQVIDKESLFEMWSKKELNVGNEILQKHIVLFGYEQFLTLLRRKDGNQ